MKHRRKKSIPVFLFISTRLYAGISICVFLLTPYLSRSLSLSLSISNIGHRFFCLLHRIFFHLHRCCVLFLYLFFCWCAVVVAFCSSKAFLLKWFHRFPQNSNKEIGNFYGFIYAILQQFRFMPFGIVSFRFVSFRESEI